MITIDLTEKVEEETGVVLVDVTSLDTPLTALGQGFKNLSEREPSPLRYVIAGVGSVDEGLVRNFSVSYLTVTIDPMFVAEHDQAVA